MIYAITGAIFFFVLSLAGRLFWATQAAGRALRAQEKSHLEWRISCLASRLLMPSALAVILLFLIAASFEGPLATTRWAVGLAVFVGVLGNHVDREVASGWQPFWKQCHDSLGTALPIYDKIEDHNPHGRASDDCQAIQFNLCHSALLNPDERQYALDRIFNADKLTTRCVLDGRRR